MIITEQLIVIPAYGREYATQQACITAYESGANFKIASGPYFSIRDESKMKENGVKTILFMHPRYGTMQYEKNL